MVYKVKDIWHNWAYDPTNENYTNRGGKRQWVYSNEESLGETEDERIKEFFSWIAFHNNGKIDNVFVAYEKMER